MKIRLDKFFSDVGMFSRRESLTAVKRGRITVNAKLVNDVSYKVDTEKDVISLDGKTVKYCKFVYLMLNKPLGVVSSTEDKRDKTVLDLISENYKKFNLFPCGRLDKDTEGLIILTNDGLSAHKRLSPKTHAEKVYSFTLAESYKSGDIEKLETGILLKDGFKTAPCKIVFESLTSGKITLIEGKYHEIRRMFGALNNRVETLKRISFAGIILDENLKSGDFRPLNEEEIKLFTK